MATPPSLRSSRSAVGGSNRTMSGNNFFNSFNSTRLHSTGSEEHLYGCQRKVGVGDKYYHERCWVGRNPTFKTGHKLRNMKGVRREGEAVVFKHPIYSLKIQLCIWVLGWWDTSLIYFGIDHKSWISGMCSKRDLNGFGYQFKFRPSTLHLCRLWSTALPEDQIDGDLSYLLLLNPALNSKGNDWLQTPQHLKKKKVFIMEKTTETTAEAMSGLSAPLFCFFLILVFLFSFIHQFLFHNCELTYLFYRTIQGYCKSWSMLSKTMESVFLHNW